MDAVSYVQEKISLDNLIHLRKCRKSFEFNELSLNYKGYESAKVIRKAIGVLKKMKVITRETAFQKIEEVFNNEYLRDWFNFQYQYEQVRERDLIRVKRIVDYICNKDYKIINADVPFTFKLDALYRGYQLQNVTGKVDFVFAKDNDIILVNIRTGENPYSKRARKMETLPEYSMELLGTALGTGKLFPDKNVYVESWYIKNKDDKTYSLVPDYENKPGKNIASLMVEDLSTLKDRFNQASTFSDDSDKCDECKHKSVCKAALKIREDEPFISKKESNAPAATPSFTDSQKSVIEHMEGPMCVIAVPGAGKTFSLVYRLANMLRKGINPQNILFVTFTNKAAAEIKQRVMKLLGTEDEKDIPNIYTYNALGYTILKDNPMFLGKRVKLADTIDRFSLIAEALSKSPKINKVSYDGIYSDYGLIKNLDKWFGKIDGKGKEAFVTEFKNDKDVDGIMRVYDNYKRLFNDRGYINFDMQISLVNKLFLKYPALPSVYAKKFKYIMVDEFQDTSEEQANMTYSIAKKHGNLVVVGDDDQSVYRWRGGSNKYMLNFGRDFPNARIVVMTDNFRSSNTILESANKLIANNGERYEKVIRGHKANAYQPLYLKNYTPNKLVTLITEIVSKGYQPGDIAVLAKYHKRLDEVEKALDGNFKVSAPKELLYEDAVFQVLYDVLSLYYYGMDEDEALYRFLKIEGVDAIKKTSNTDSLYHSLVGSNLLLPIDKMDVNCLSTYEKYKDVSIIMAAGFKLISCFKKIQYGKGISALNEVLYVLFGISNHKVMDSLLDIADERAIVTISELYSFMTDMKLYQDDKTVEYEPCCDAINLLTCHSSKGKEFPVVIVYGTEDFKQEEEETRLFYVSITRAKNTLFMIETEYNECELFPKLAGSVLVR